MLRPFLKGIAGTTPDRVFAVGQQGVIIRFDGASWIAPTTTDPLPFGTQRPDIQQPALNAVGSTDSNVYAVGEVVSPPTFPNVQRLGANGWSAVNPSGVGKPALQGVWVSPEGDVFSVGSDGCLLHKNKDVDAWQKEPASGPEFRAVSGSSPVDVFAVGDAGEIRRFTAAD